IALTRQSVPVLERPKQQPASQTMKGAYILSDSDKQPDVILMATGSEVQLAVEAQKSLMEQDIHARVVSMPCWELFEKQDQKYRDEVLPPSVDARISIEAASPFGWERWIGQQGTAIGVDHFGASAPYQEIFQHFGITVERIVEEAVELIG